MSLQRKLKNALDETRLLILGAQVLFDSSSTACSRKLLPTCMLHCA